MLDAWREQGADRRDPLRFRLLEALERRAGNHGGEVRRLLDSRLSELAAAYAGDLRNASDAGEADNAAALNVPVGETLGGLNDYIAGQAAIRGGSAAADNLAPGRSFPELAALDNFRRLWASVRSESQLRQSLGQTSANSGPLNSGRLVHRSFTLMRELSPGYLQQFLSYVDALAWLEQWNEDGVIAAEDSPRAASRTANGRKRTRDNPRRRRE